MTFSEPSSLPLITRAVACLWRAFLRNPRPSDASMCSAAWRLSRLARITESCPDDRSESVGEDTTPIIPRRTYASLRVGTRDDLIYIAEQLGHRDARFTFPVYQRAAKRREKLSGSYLEAFDAALDRAHLGARGDSRGIIPSPDVLTKNNPNRIRKPQTKHPGRLAQLGERQLDKLEVTGSSPVTPTHEKPC